MKIGTKDYQTETPQSDTLKSLKELLHGLTVVVYERSEESLEICVLGRFPQPHETH